MGRLSFGLLRVPFEYLCVKSFLGSLKRIKNSGWGLPIRQNTLNFEQRKEIGKARTKWWGTFWPDENLLSWVRFSLPWLPSYRVCYRFFYLGLLSGPYGLLCTSYNEIVRNTLKFATNFVIACPDILKCCPHPAPNQLDFGETRRAYKPLGTLPYRFLLGR